MMTKILITGGSGLVGTALTEQLISKGYEVVHLGRQQDTNPGITKYTWSPMKGEIDESAFDGVDYIVNLAGANLSEKRWTRERKNEIKKSRTKSTELIFDRLQQRNEKPKALVSASAIGYYGYDSGSIEKKEGSRFGDDFLATVVKEWEAEVDKFTDLNIRTVKLRMGLVLSKKGGALEKIAKPVKLGFGAALGRGDQYISWIHIEDLCGIIIKALEDQTLNGVYNAVSPNPVTNKEFTRQLALILKRPFFLPNVPGFLLKIMLGEMASLVLGGNKVSSEKIENSGFKFQYPDLTVALIDLIRQRRIRD